MKTSKHRHCERSDCEAKPKQERSEAISLYISQNHRRLLRTLRALAMTRVSEIASGAFGSLAMTMLFVALMTCIHVCFASEDVNPAVAFYRGNNYYEQAKYDEAIAEYQMVLNAGYESGNLYYNLANAYFKKGLLGEAILNYKRAERLIPYDVDLKANLGYARSAVQQPVVQVANLFVRLLANVVGGFSADSLTVFLAILYIIIFACATGLLFIKAGQRPLRVLLLLSCAVFIIAAAGFFIKINQISQPWAVVLDREAAARYEPFDSATAYFEVFQGQEVLLVKKKGDWAFVKRPDGKAGWVKSASIEKI